MRGTAALRVRIPAPDSPLMLAQIRTCAPSPRVVTLAHHVSWEHLARLVQVAGELATLRGCEGAVASCWSRRRPGPGLELEHGQVEAPFIQRQQRACSQTNEERWRWDQGEHIGVPGQQERKHTTRSGSKKPDGEKDEQEPAHRSKRRQVLF